MQRGGPIRSQRFDKGCANAAGGSDNQKAAGTDGLSQILLPFGNGVGKERSVTAKDARQEFRRNHGNRTSLHPCSWASKRIFHRMSGTEPMARGYSAAASGRYAGLTSRRNLPHSCRNG